MLAKLLNPFFLIRAVLRMLKGLMVGVRPDDPIGEDWGWGWGWGWVREEGESVEGAY
jgi:hypothetical protein